MWRTFGSGPSAGGGGMGGGGAPAGGGRMLRSVQRAIRTGGNSSNGSSNNGGYSNSSGSASPSNSNSATTTKSNLNKSNNQFALSSSLSAPLSLLNIPGCVAATAPYWAPCTCIDCAGEFEWERVDGVEDERAKGSFDDHGFGFGEVPSAEEVEQAVYSLQQVIDPTFFSQYIRDKNAYNSENDEIDTISSPTGSQKAGSELDWMEPSLQGYVSRTFHSPGPSRVYDAFHLLQADPSIKRMVVSLSSDKAVWEAVLNNEVVRELRDSLSKADKDNSGSSKKGGNAATHILSWIFVNTKAKVMELVDKITKLVNELFQPQVEDKAALQGEEYTQGNFQKAVQTSFLLSILVLLIVVVGRVRLA